MRLTRLPRSLAVAAVATGVLLTAACGGSGSTAAPEPGGDTAPENFTFTSWNYGEDAQKALIEQEVAGFTEGKGITADFSSFPFAEYRNQVLLRSRSGEITGAAQLDIADLNSLAEAGALVDLGSYAAQGGYTEEALANGQVDGTQYGLPWYTGSIGLISNEGLLEEAGVTEAPTTVAEFEDALRKVKQHDPDVVPYALATKPEAVKDFIPWFKTFGSTVVDGETITVNDAGGVEALTWMKKLYDDGLISMNIGRPEARTLYAQNRTAFFDDANQVRGTLAAQAEDDEVIENTVPLARPVKTAGDQPQALAWGGLIVVFDEGPVDTAADFASFITSDTQTALNRYEKIGSAPTTTEALADPAFADDEYSSTWQTASTENASPNPLWVFPEYSQMEAALAAEIQAAFNGDKTPQEALDAAQAEMQEMVG